MGVYFFYFLVFCSRFILKSLTVFYTVLRSYMWFVVYSYFQELKENKIKAGALLDEKPQVNKKQEASKDEETKDYCALSPA